MQCVCGNHFHYCAALPLQMQLQKTQKQLQKICKQSCTTFWKLMGDQTQHSSEEAFRFFRRSLPILGRILPICSAGALQTHFRKHSKCWCQVFWCVPYICNYILDGNCCTVDHAPNSYSILSFSSEPVAHTQSTNFSLLSTWQNVPSLPSLHSL